DSTAQVSLPGDAADDEAEREVDGEDHQDAGDVRADVATHDQQRGHQSEDGTRGADGGGSGVDQGDGDRTAQRADQIQGQVSPAAEHGLEDLTQHPQRQHVQRQVDEAAVHEGGGEQAPGLEGEGGEVGVQVGAGEQQPLRDLVADAGQQLQQADERGERQQRVGDEGPAAAPGHGDGAPGTAAPAPLCL